MPLEDFKKQPWPLRKLALSNCCKHLRAKLKAKTKVSPDQENCVLFSVAVMVASSKQVFCVTFHLWLPSVGTLCNVLTACFVSPHSLCNI